MGANIWQPGSTPLAANDGTTLVTQTFVANAGQKVFDLTAFNYTTGVGALLVFKNGQLLVLGEDYFETSSSSFTILTATTAGDKIVAFGFVGITGNITTTTLDLVQDNITALSAYNGSQTLQYVRGTSQPLDGGEGWFELFSGAAAGTYVEDGVNVIFPATTTDGSAAWKRQDAATLRARLELNTVSQTEAEARTETVTRAWTAQRVGQAIAAGITEIVTGSFIANLYEALANKNAFTDAEKAKLAELSPTSPLVGAVLPFASATVPSGWLVCDGSAVSRTTYADLFAFIGVTFGPGDNVSTFNLPDLRGQFIRGWDNGAGVDAGRSFGSNQEDMVGPHNHPFNRNLTATNEDPPAASGQAGGDGYAGYEAATANSSGIETRPVNVALQYCIKY